ncbi:MULTISPECIES: hypothetical protein [unclassified Leisingera]|uniref:hypothetical protein n=1 Tax=unclassified Leisingera TaxID=2614906 RepID=UPI0002F40D7B|nr:MULTISPECIES: hypothetical protein [unclassified Leisingera]KIC16030.1 hypothetical protein RA21_14570 [Leisingera sp. ANG-DT]KIC26169.1 hypothetical protein RA23_04350 [Leisingera sp. ANG-S3]KIC30787.1 hypothetical protein RA24_02080 [Leisingera sp. ANG-M6]KIC30863.1 hypothetical protein RA25_18265 [Leisingera sp. ANG-S5]KIC55025.1 hypothetical protein RA22_02895 [Leisingera sp. ANG-S]
MDLGIDPSAVAAGSQEVTSTFVMFGTIAFVGFFGRMIFVAFGPGLAKSNPFRNFSGGGFILLAAALFAGGLYASGKMTKATVLFKRHLADPVIVTLLGKDSCDPADGSYCVVVFEDGQEKIVNWYNKRVYMYEIVNPPEGAVWHTLRPRHRPGLAAGV